MRLDPTAEAIMATGLKAACVVAVTALHLGGAGQAGAGCSKESWTEFERQLASAQDAFQSQNPAPILALWSHAPDVSLMGAFGGHEVGWSLIEPRLKWVSQLTSNGSHDGDEVLVRVVGSDVATVV